jgi:hypothetical protein
MGWTVIAFALLVLGGLICCANFYCAFLRYPLHRVFGGTRENYHYGSGVPLFGSFFVAIALMKFWSDPTLLSIAIVLILIDMGGLHWFLGVMFWYEVLKKGNRDKPNP